MKILNTLAAHKVKFGQDSVSRKKLGGLAKVPGASTVRNALAKLKKELWVEVNGDEVVITDRGMQHANVEAVEIPTSNAEHHAKIKQDLTAKQVALFDLISDGHVHSKTEVMEALGMSKNSSWRNLLAALAKEHIIEHEKDKIQLTERRFPVVPRPTDA